MLVTVLFALLYRVLPDVQIPWRDVWAGAILTALLLSVGKWAIGFYLGRSELASEYGTAGSMMVLLFWVYYASLLVLLGAVFTRIQSAASPRGTPAGGSGRAESREEEGSAELETGARDFRVGEKESFDCSGRSDA